RARLISDSQTSFPTLLVIASRANCIASPPGSIICYDCCRALLLPVSFTRYTLALPTQIASFGSNWSEIESSTLCVIVRTAPGRTPPLQPTGAAQTYLLA